MMTRKPICGMGGAESGAVLRAGRCAALFGFCVHALQHYDCPAGAFETGNTPSQAVCRRMGREPIRFDTEGCADPLSPSSGRMAK